MSKANRSVRRELLTPEERVAISIALTAGNSRAASALAEAVERGAMKNGPYEIFDPYEIFERDGWICKRCHSHTPEWLRSVNHDNSPTLDHIISILKGGRHTRANCQLLCKLCNSVKDNIAAA